MKLLDHWLNVPDEKFGRLATQLGANLVIDAEVGRRCMVCRSSPRHPPYSVPVHV